MNRDTTDAADADGEVHTEAAEQGVKPSAEVGKKKRKAGKAPIDAKQYKSITSMFSRMQDVQQQKQHQQAQQQTAEDEHEDDIEEIEVDEVADHESNAQLDKRQKTTGQKRVESGGPERCGTRAE